jgi:hypothetical protein
VCVGVGLSTDVRIYAFGYPRNNSFLYEAMHGRLTVRRLCSLLPKGTTGKAGERFLRNWNLRWDVKGRSG